MEFNHSNPSLDDTLDVVADARRRAVLQFLSDHSDTVVSIEDVIGYLDARERATGGEQATTPEQLETELQHSHFPKLEAQGLIEYDLRSGQIRYTPDETTEDLLQFLRNL